MTDRFAEHVIREAIADELMRQWPNTITRRDAARVTTDAVLATRIPRACQTCGGEGEVTGPGMHDEQCPDCPTIGTLLLCGWNVAKAERIYNDDWSLWGTAINGQWVGNEDTLTALREMPVSKLTQEPT